MARLGISRKHAYPSGRGSEAGGARVHGGDRGDCSQVASSRSMTGIQRIGVAPHLSHVAVHNGIVHLSGVVSPGKSVREQTRNVLAGIDELLQSAGSDKSKIL